MVSLIRRDRDIGDDLDVLTFDIETIADLAFLTDETARSMRRARARGKVPSNYKDPAKIDAFVEDKLTEWDSKAALSPYTGKVAGWGCALGMQDVEAQASLTEEKSLLETFFHEFSRHPVVLTGWNVRRFDIPFLTMRAMILGVRVPDWWPHVRNYRHIVDLMDMTQDVPGSDPKTLDYTLHRLGLPLKTASGSEVEDMSPEQIREYVTADVERERAIAVRVAPGIPQLRGLL